MRDKHVRTTSYGLPYPSRFRAWKDSIKSVSTCVHNSPIRDAVESDVEDLTRLWYASFNSSHEFWNTATPDDPISRWNAKNEGRDHKPKDSLDG
ncbi:hypothetical protein TWF128_005563 [Orbilia oligospora]|nr:hypothetical protein TWF128_005563 [Orbilia oligospora]